MNNKLINNNIYNIAKIKAKYHKNEKLLNSIIKKIKTIRIINNNELKKNEEEIENKKIKFGAQIITVRPYIKNKKNYEIIKKKIGEGGYGKIYRTTNNKIGFKTIQDEIIYEDEYKSLIFHYLLLQYYKGTPQVKYLCKLFEFGRLFPYQNKEYNYYYAYMEIFGNDLNSLKYNSNSNLLLKFTNIFKILYQCCESVKLIHNLEYLHLDIKPENFLIKDNKIKIIDFGFVNKNALKTSGRIGTKRYISNDWMKNFEENKTTTLNYHHDIFSLGCMFVELLYKFILNTNIFIACPLIKNKPINGITKNRISYNQESYKIMCDTIYTDLKKKNTSIFVKDKELNKFIILSIDLIKLMCHPNPEERCNNIDIIIKMIDTFFKSINIKINENENIIVRRIN